MPLSKLQRFQFFKRDRFYCLLSAIVFSFHLSIFLQSNNHSLSILTFVTTMCSLIIFVEFLYFFKGNSVFMKKRWLLLIFVFFSLGFHLLLALFLLEELSIYFEIFVLVSLAEKLFEPQMKIIIIERVFCFLFFSARLRFFSQNVIQSLLYVLLLVLLTLKIMKREKPELLTKHLATEISKPLKNQEKDKKKEPDLEILGCFKEAILLFDKNSNIKWHSNFIFQALNVPKEISKAQLESLVLNIAQEESCMPLQALSFKSENAMQQVFKAFQTKIGTMTESILEIEEEELKSPGLLISRKHNINPSKNTVTISTGLNSDPTFKSMEDSTKKLFKASKAYLVNQNGNFETETDLKAQVSKKMKDFLQEIFLKKQSLTFNTLEEECDFSKNNIYGSLCLEQDQKKLSFFISFYPSKIGVFVCLRPLDKNDLFLSLFANNLNHNKQLASMCHELRTPLNSVTNILEIMQSELGSTQNSQNPHQEYISTALMSSKLLLSSINDFLDFFSITSNLFSLEVHNVNLRKFIKEIFDFFQPYVEKKGIKLQIKLLCKNSKIVSTDEKRLKQIIFNLLNNSIRFTQKGFICLHVKEKTKDFLKISVLDSGSGIEPTEMPTLGNFQHSKQNKSRTTGGFGLSITNYLANYLGPSRNEAKKQGLFKGLKVKSEFGQGTKFSFLVRNTRNFKIEAIEESLLSIQEGSVLSVGKEMGKEVIDRFKQENKSEFKFFDSSRTEVNTDTIINYLRKNTGNDSLKIQAENPRILTSELSAKNIIKDYNDLKVTSIDAAYDSLKINAEKPKILTSELSTLNIKDCKCPKVLAVDDNEFNLFILRERFKKKNISIDTSTSGVEAIENISAILEGAKTLFCEKCRFYKVILMDIDMPIKNGFETTLELKQQLGKYGVKVPIVALSAFSQSGYKEQAFEAGVSMYFEKPLPPEIFDSIVTDYVENI